MRKLILIAALSGAVLMAGLISMTAIGSQGADDPAGTTAPAAATQTQSQTTTPTTQSTTATTTHRHRGRGTDDGPNHDAGDDRGGRNRGSDDSSSSRGSSSDSGSSSNRGPSSNSGSSNTSGRSGSSGRGGARDGPDPHRENEPRPGARRRPSHGTGG